MILSMVLFTKLLTVHFSLGNKPLILSMVLFTKLLTDVATMNNGEGF